MCHETMYIKRKEMKTFRKICQAFALILALTSCGNSFRFSPTTVISVENERQKAVADWFAWLFAKSGGFVPMVVEDSFGADVVLREDASMGHGAYRLKVTGRRMCIEASSSIGFFYAFQFVRHSLPEDINASCHADRVEWKIPVMSLSDSSSAEYSGLVLDLCCRFLPKDNLLHLIASMPDMGIYDLILVNDKCYTMEDLEEVNICAVANRVGLLSEHTLAMNTVH